MMINKPWGSEFLWAITKNYAAKIIEINKNSRLSLQKHLEKEETIFVLSGTLYLTIDSEEIKLKPGSYYHISPNTIHRFSAKDEPVSIMEVSTSQLNDIVRIEDDYNRK